MPRFRPALLILLAFTAGAAVSGLAVFAWTSYQDTRAAREKAYAAEAVAFAMRREVPELTSDQIGDAVQLTLAAAEATDLSTLRPTITVTVGQTAFEFRLIRRGTSDIRLIVDISGPTTPQRGYEVECVRNRDGVWKGHIASERIY
jgi:hypothetical protein